MILLVDATTRENSRTKELGYYLLDKLVDKDVLRVELKNEDIKPLDEERIERRTFLSKMMDFNDEIFKYAKSFKEADTIIFLTPYYDLSFSSLIKIYIENICISGLTFRYSEEGYPISLSNAKKMYYVTTSGGPIINDSFGYGYIKEVMHSFFGVEDTTYIKSEMLDVIGYDPIEILNKTKKQIDETFK